MTSKHTILINTNGAFVLSTFAGSSKTCKVFVLNLHTGEFHRLRWADREEGLEASVTAVSDGSIPSMRETFPAIIGSVSANGCINFLVAKKCTERKFPDLNHTVNIIERTEWISIRLHTMHYRSDELQLPSGAVTEACKLYFSETLDLTVPFSSAIQTTTRQSCEHVAIDGEHAVWSKYCWNQWLLRPFLEADLFEWCTVVLEGIVTPVASWVAHSDQHVPAEAMHTPHQPVVSGGMLVSKRQCHTASLSHELDSTQVAATGVACEISLWTGTHNRHMDDAAQQSTADRPTTTGLDNGESADQSSASSVLTWVSHMWFQGTHPEYLDAIPGSKGAERVLRPGELTYEKEAEELASRYCQDLSRDGCAASSGITFVDFPAHSGHGSTRNTTPGRDAGHTAMRTRSAVTVTSAFDDPEEYAALGVAALGGDAVHHSPSPRSRSGTGVATASPGGDAKWSRTIMNRLKSPFARVTPRAGRSASDAISGRQHGHRMANPLADMHLADTAGEVTRTQSLSLMLSPTRSTSRVRGGEEDVSTFAAPSSAPGATPTKGRTPDVLGARKVGPRWLGDHGFARPMRVCERVDCIVFDWHQHVASADASRALAVLWKALRPRVLDYRWSYGRAMRTGATTQHTLLQRQKGYLHFTYEKRTPKSAPGNYYVLLPIIGSMTQCLMRHDGLLPTMSPENGDAAVAALPTQDASLATSTTAIPMEVPDHVRAEDVLATADLTKLTTFITKQLSTSFRGFLQLDLQRQFSVDDAGTAPCLSDGIMLRAGQQHVYRKSRTPNLHQTLTPRRNSLDPIVKSSQASQSSHDRWQHRLETTALRNKEARQWGYLRQRATGIHNAPHRNLASLPGTICIAATPLHTADGHVLEPGAIFTAEGVTDRAVFTAPGVGLLEMDIFLGEFCTLDSFSIVVPGGCHPHANPSTVEVWAGTSLSDLVLVVSADLPRVKTPTSLLYTATQLWLQSLLHECASSPLSACLHRFLNALMSLQHECA
eukprot:m.412860 g.412860  ORF g.412860 m.412860 type:complete len:997 (-) comp21258_c0_seq13:2325-5315(-)